MYNKIISLLLFLGCGPIFGQTQTDTAFKVYQQNIPGSSVAISLAPIPGGSFVMGSSSKNKLSEQDEMPSHNIQLSPFWMGVYEIKYEEFNLFFDDDQFSQNINADAITRPSSPYLDLTLGMGKIGGFPANSMQQYGAIMFCKWLYKKTGIFYRLPTEAEWEYACRAGASSLYPFGNDSASLADYAWYNKNSDEKYHAVGQKKPNAWGLYDMLGNVAEWTLDQYEAAFYNTLSDTSTNPLRAPERKHPRTLKGGSFQDGAKELRCANRIMSDLVWNRRDPQIPKSRWWNADSPFVGFRIVRPYQQPTPEQIEHFFSLYLK